MALRWLRAGLVALGIASAPLPALAQGAAASGDLDAANLQTLQAFQGGDSALALTRARAAAALARARPDAAAESHAFSLANLAYLLSGTGEDAAAVALWHEALAHLAAHGQTVSQAGFAAMTGLAAHEAHSGRNLAAREGMRDALAHARASPFHGQVAAAAVSLFLDIAAYQDAAIALGEAATSDPETLRPTHGALYSRLAALAEQAEQEGRAGDVASLIEARLILLRLFVDPETAREAIRNLKFQRYFALNGAGEHDRARSELLAWLKSGEMTETERDFIAAMTEIATQLGDDPNIDTLERLETARTALAFATALGTPSDPRLGRALWAVASAESHFGQTDREAHSLTEAIAILERSPEGRRDVPAVLAQLGWNSFLRGQSDQAAALFQRADRARAAAPGPDPRTPFDRASDAANRARFHVDSGDPAAAATWVERARADLSGAAADGWPATLLRNRLLGLEALIAMETGTTPPLAALRVSAGEMQATAPPDNPEHALALTNMADTFLVAGEIETARTLLERASAINAAALPDFAPQAIETGAKLAQIALMTGDRADMIARYRTLTEARKSPLYRPLLAAAAWDFELFAWALLDDPASRTPDRLDEAFQALQWTQITRSAEALGQMETRLALEDPTRGALLRERQTLVETYERDSARLADALATPTADPTARTALMAQLGALEAAMAETDTRLAALGLDTGGIGRVTPMSLAKVQAVLAPGEALVTFLLPSLNPDRVPGLGSSSNHVIAVTRDAVHVKRLGEISRTALNARIAALRCDMAISDPGCATGGAAALRGAMLDETEPQAPADLFDFDGAHRLYRDLFGGLSDMLADQHSLIIVPPADMLRLPFPALLVTPSTDRSLAHADWMLRHHAISVLPSIASLRALRATPHATRPIARMLGFGDPETGSSARIDCNAPRFAALRAAPPTGPHMAKQTGPDGVRLADIDFLARLPRLPDSRCELQAIAAGFAAENVVLNTGAAATETRLKSLGAAGGLRGFDLLVFATHGLTAGEAGAASPGLVLTPPAHASALDDGLLTAAEIATLELDARLVVLSACNTAAGEGNDHDGLSGLARAFFQAGAQSLLVTHWSVYSEAATDLTTGLFAELKQHPGLGHAAALRAATLRILDDPLRPDFNRHPSWWAAFAVIGAT